MFTLGFVLGDGSDYAYNHNNSKGVKIRLCGKKIQYLDLFIKAGYKIQNNNSNPNDIFLSKTGKTFKQRFIENHCWEFLSYSDLVSLFKGYYAADGSLNENKIATSNPDLAQMIRDISAVAGFHISSEKYEVRNTNYKNNAELYTFHFIKSQPSNRNWTVKEIKITGTSPYDAWCLVEPITHTFTLEGGIVTGNCALVNAKDQLDNGTVINETLIERPKSFQTACTVLTQIGQFPIWLLILELVVTRLDKLKEKNGKVMDLLLQKNNQKKQY